MRYSYVRNDSVKAGKEADVLALGIDFVKPQRGGFGVEVVYRSTEVNVAANGSHRETKSQPFNSTVVVSYGF